MVWCTRRRFCLSTEGKLLALNSRRPLMKMDQCYSSADSRTQCTAQPISCVVSPHIAAAFTRSGGDKSLASGEPWSVEENEEETKRGRKWKKKNKNRRRRIKREMDLETKRTRGREEKYHKWGGTEWKGQDICHPLLQDQRKKEQYH